MSGMSGQEEASNHLELPVNTLCRQIVTFFIQTINLPVVHSQVVIEQFAYHCLVPVARAMAEK